MREMAVRIIQRYLRDCKKRKKVIWPLSVFAQRCYSESAAIELLRYFEERSGMVSDSVFESFIRKMDNLSCSNRRTRFMFSVAKDTAEYLYDCFLLNRREIRKL